MSKFQKFILNFLTVSTLMSIQILPLSHALDCLNAAIDYKRAEEAWQSVRQQSVRHMYIPVTLKSKNEKKSHPVSYYKGENWELFEKRAAKKFGFEIAEVITSHKVFNSNHKICKEDLEVLPEFFIIGYTGFFNVRLFDINQYVQSAIVAIPYNREETWRDFERRAARVFNVKSGEILLNNVAVDHNFMIANSFSEVPKGNLYSFPECSPKNNFLFIMK